MASTDPPKEEVSYHEHDDPHRPSSWLVDVVLGGQDGLVNVLGVVLGVAAATPDVRIVLAAGLAATFAESVSMAAVAYTSSVAQGELYESERAREYRHVEQAPHLERDEVREMYRNKGFDGELLERIVTTITADKDVWVAVMMREEHQLAKVDRSRSLKSALIVGVSAMVGSVIPLVPFLLVGVGAAKWIALAASAATLFAFGAYKAKVTVGHPMKSGAELAIIGTVSALVGYGVGALFGAAH
jgi:predicted membrane protein (TIGR00267 family)